jgi:energy-coupling factor transporter ATP-binding protein EcfA2
VPGPALELRGAVKRFGGEAAVGPIDLAVPAGATLALIGPSGAGKSTVLRLMLGLLRPERGQVLLGGAPLDPDDDAIPLLGIGTGPAVAALALHALLPVVRNTHAGLTGIAPELLESARSLGLSGWARLRHVELPLAAPAILAGVKTAAVIAVGTATLGALVGAGGYGQPILTGIRLASVPIILEGAIPAAVLALLVQGAFDALERVLVPRGLRRSGSRA